MAGVHGGPSSLDLTAVICRLLVRTGTLASFSCSTAVHWSCAVEQRSLPAYLLS